MWTASINFTSNGESYEEMPDFPDPNSETLCIASRDMPHKMARYLYKFWCDTKSPCSKMHHRALLKSKGYRKSFALQTSNSPKTNLEQIKCCVNSSFPEHWDAFAVIGQGYPGLYHCLPDHLLQQGRLERILSGGEKPTIRGGSTSVAVGAPERHFGARSMIRNAQLSEFLVHLRQKQTVLTAGRALTTIEFGNLRSLMPHIDFNDLQN